MIRLLLAGTFLLAYMLASTDAAEINIGYLRRAEPTSTLSLIEVPAANDGAAGARLAIDDNNTTGTFLISSFCSRMCDSREAPMGWLRRVR